MGVGELLAIKVGTEKGVTSIILSGELDLATTPMLNASLGSLASDGDGVIVLDLQNLSFMDLSGLRALLQAKERCDPNGPGLVVMGASPTVRRLFEVTGTEFLLGDESTLRTLRRLVGESKARTAERSGATHSDPRR